MNRDINQCLKNGAKVLLTGEKIAAHGDLYFVSTPGQGQDLILHYTLPHQSVSLKDDEPWPEEYDAVFDTETNRCEEFLDLQGAQVMVMKNAHAYVSRNVPVPKGYSTVPANSNPLQTMLDALGVDVKVFSIGKDENGG